MGEKMGFFGKLVAGLQKNERQYYRRCGFHFQRFFGH